MVMSSKVGTSGLLNDISRCMNFYVQLSFDLETTMWSESDLCYAPNFLIVAVQTDMCNDIELVGVDQRSDVNQIVQVISIPV